MICYVDEVGMSSISGMVLVCAVVSKTNTPPTSGIKDSKKLTKKSREMLYPKLSLNLEHAFGVASLEEIKQMNIFYARFLAMKRAIEELISKGTKIDKIIVDGKFTIPDLDIPQEAIVRADATIWQVGAASILAKVRRDNMMANLTKVEKYSYYDWQNNAGYYSPAHRDGIILHGPCDLHRTGFVYFQYCLERHEEFKTFVKNGNTPDDFFRHRDSKKESDYVLWKESKKKIWQPILPNKEKK